MAAAADGVVHRGEIRMPGGQPAAGSIALQPDACVLEAAGSPARTIAYRDLALIAIDGGVGLLVTGTEPGAERFLLERFGAAIGPVVAALRERRLRQRLADGFVEVAPEPPVDLVEYGRPATGTAPAEHGVALLAFDGWGLTLAPVDERQPVRRVRRADVAGVEHVPEIGGVRVHAGPNAFEVLRQGTTSVRLRDRIASLPAAALADARAIVGGLLPTAASGTADRAAGLLLDGRPAGPAELGPTWAPLENAMLGEPAFAASYNALVARAGGDAALRWLAIAPETPGRPDRHKGWFIVALPGNLVALELVTEGSHATYCFRVVPRAEYRGGIDPAAATGAVAGISAALVDARFLREPMALPQAQMATPEGIRYQLALRALPSLARARSNFVARLVHSSEEAWATALDNLVAWHGACRDDAATWPGRGAQESQIIDTSGTAG